MAFPLCSHALGLEHVSGVIQGRDLISSPEALHPQWTLLILPETTRWLAAEGAGRPDRGPSQQRASSASPHP